MCTQLCCVLFLAVTTRKRTQHNRSQIAWGINSYSSALLHHYDVIKWKLFLHYWSFVSETTGHGDKGQWRDAFMSLSSAPEQTAQSRSLWRHCNGDYYHCHWWHRVARVMGLNRIIFSFLHVFQSYTLEQILFGTVTRQYTSSHSSNSDNNMEIIANLGKKINAF